MATITKYMSNILHRVSNKFNTTASVQTQKKNMEMPPKNGIQTGNYAPDESNKGTRVGNYMV
jgi:hypothetical protein